jgi:hypothetical protein
VSVVPDDTLLDDPRRLAEADTDGVLRAAALAGAQVRATAEMADEVGIRRLDGFRPRALVLVTRPGVGPLIADLLVSLLTPACPVPVVVADAVPSWVGPLDVVVADTEDPGDNVLAESVDRATRYGATTVVTAPEHGPVAAAGAGKALLLPPRVAVPPGFGFPRALCAALLVVVRLGLLRVNVPALADELDKEAERDHPGHESFVNPAKSLALRVAERVPMLWGLDPVATAVARRAAHVLSGHAGFVCDSSGYPQALTRLALYRAAVRSTSGHSLFADPDDVDNDPTSRLRVLLLSVRTDEVAEHTRRSALGTLSNADVLTPAEEIAGDESTLAAVLALRFELAACYLGLAAGTIGGSGRHAPANA